MKNYNNISCVNIFIVYTMASGLATTPVLAQLPSARSVVDHINARSEVFQNLHSASDWEYYGRAGGASLLLRSCERREIYSDNLMRIRIDVSPLQCVQQPNLSDSIQKPVSRIIYDGEKTVTLEYFSALDRTGKRAATKAPARSAAVGAKVKPGYRTASVQDGLYPSPLGPWSLDNPITFIDQVPRAITTCITDGSFVEVKEAKEKSGIYIVNYKLIASKDPWNLTYSATIDSNLGWAVKGFRALTSQGRLAIESGCDYQVGADGLALPARGFWRNWSLKEPGGSPPLMEKRFAVTTIRANDPNFMDAVFKVTVEGDTAVSDLRYGVDYRVGAEKLVDANLTNLAAAARAAQDAAASDPTNRNDRGNGSLWQSLVLIAVILFVLGALGVTIWKRRTK